MTFAIEENVSLSALTTIRLGGLARYFVQCHSAAELREALIWAKKRGLRVHVLGGGSNTIFRDEGFDGLVVRVELTGIQFEAKEQDVIATVAAGEEWDPFVTECVRRALAGVECLSGIPGLVGATPMQNVGAYGQEVSQTIAEVRTLEVETLAEKVFLNNECGFGYRWSRFKGKDAGKYIVTVVTFQLRVGGAPTISYQQVKDNVTSAQPTLQDVRGVVLGLRKKKSMVIDARDPNTRSCGSFFENLQLTTRQLEELHKRAKSLGIVQEVPTFQEAGVVRVPTAWLIEQTGFPKGFRRGGVGISVNHNLALVNYGGTSQELLAFADEIVAAVREKFGVALKREPVVVS